MFYKEAFRFLYLGVIFSFIPLFAGGLIATCKNKWMKGKWSWFLTTLFLLALPAGFIDTDSLWPLLLPFLPFLVIPLLCTAMRRLGKPCSKSDVTAMLCMGGFIFLLFLLYWYGVGYTYRQSLTP